MELIADRPSTARSASRLLALVNQEIQHLEFSAIRRLLRPDDVLVVNDTKVIKARLNAVKDSGGRVELLVERIVQENEALCHSRSSRPLRTGRRLFADGCEMTVIARTADLFRIRFSEPVNTVLERCGEVPLPPYIRRPATMEDARRYQTVYAKNEGAVAAPTAGLHFDEELLRNVQNDGVKLARITLHVGAGTFQPLREESLSDVRMHTERYSIGKHARADIDGRKGRLVAVGTTVVRTLESAALSGEDEGETGLFIKPGFEFKVVDALITNFHLPESTLIMLVSAFAGYQRIMDAYRIAVDKRYRFFSYGDAMFLNRHEV